MVLMNKKVTYSMYNTIYFLSGIAIYKQGNKHFL